MSAHSRGARAHTDLTGKLRGSFARHRAAFLGGAALLGLALVPRPKKIVVNKRGGTQAANAGKAGVFLGTVKVVLDLTKPLIMAWATKRIADMAKATKQVERKVDRVDAKT
jgi:hypothetical protein